jgi:outer membrane protein TolC
MSRFPISRRGRAALAFAGLLALAPGAMAQQGPVISARPGQRPARPFPAPVDGAVKLSLDDAIGLALSNNQDLNVTVNAAQASQYNLMSSEGIFDPVLGAFANRNHQEQPNSTILAGATVGLSDTYNFGGDVTQLAPWGGTFSLGVTGGRFATNSTFYTVNPTYNAGLKASFSQPLLRNFGFATTKWLIWIAKNSRDASYQQYLRSVQTTVNNVEQAYWDLVYTLQNLEVKKESLRIASELNRITKIKIDVGSLAPIDITQTEVGIAQAEQDIITAEGQVGDALDRLRRQLNIDPALGNAPIVPTDEVRTQPIAIELPEGTRMALVRRPEVVAQAYTADSDRIRYDYWSNQVLPGVNLVGSWGTVGGTFAILDQNGNVVDVVADGLGAVYRQALDRNFRNWTIGLNISYPILNRYAKGQRGAAKYTWESDKAFLTTTQQNVIVEVRAAARAIDTASRQIVAASKGRELAEKNLDAEKKKFDNGMSTTFQVNQIQRDLSAARTTELQALVVYRKAVAAYHYAVADILDWKKIGVEGIPETTLPLIESPLPPISKK